MLSWLDEALCPAMHEEILSNSSFLMCFENSWLALFAAAIWDTDRPLKKQKLEEDEKMSEPRRSKIPATFLAATTTALYSPGSRIQLSIYLAYLKRLFRVMVHLEKRLAKSA